MKRKTKSLLWRVATVGVLAAAAAAIASSYQGGAVEAEEVYVPVDDRIVSADTEFGFRVLNELRQATLRKNVFISPASIALALSMTYNGAGGETKQAMEEALELSGLSIQQINAANAALLENLGGPGPGVTLDTANSLWAKQGVAFKPDFLARNREFYKAEVTSLDLGSPGSKDRINAWVEGKTRDRIKDIIKQIPPEAILILVNAVYFKGQWQHKFDEADTKPHVFHVVDKGYDVPMMSQVGEFRYLEMEAFQAIELPYGEGRLSMYVFLPTQDTGLGGLCGRLTGESWRQWRSAMVKRKGHIALPRFKLEYEARDEMKAALTAMGMGVAFDPGKADFGGMADVGAENVYIAEIAHKTFLEVNEEGTEAAGATSVTVGVTSVAPTKPFDMVVDRPFLLAIVDNKTDAVLFVGAITAP